MRIKLARATDINNGVRQVVAYNIYIPTKPWESRMLADIQARVRKLFGPCRPMKSTGGNGMEP